MTRRQSTNHIMMMEPKGFHANPQTKATNDYQADDPDSLKALAAVQEQAVLEFRALRDALVEHGVIVTTAQGALDSPDDVFCNNWVATDQPLDGGNGRSIMALFPMLADNRKVERRPHLVEKLSQSFDMLVDLTSHENDGIALESTGALCMDRVNKVIYCALSERADKALAQQYADLAGYEIHFFDTANHVGKPVYHTDVLMYIGTGYVGLCTEVIVEADRQRIIDQISKTHEIIDLSMDQLASMCGNALEVRGTDDNLYLVMSAAAHQAMHEDQIKQIDKYVAGVISAPIPTIEKYGGGSARCMLLELF